MYLKWLHEPAMHPYLPQANDVTVMIVNAAWNHIAHAKDNEVIDNMNCLWLEYLWFENTPPLLSIK